MTIDNPQTPAEMAAFLRSCGSQIGDRIAGELERLEADLPSPAMARMLEAVIAWRQARRSADEAGAADRLEAAIDAVVEARRPKGRSHLQAARDALAESRKNSRMTEAERAKILLTLAKTHLE